MSLCLPAQLWITISSVVSRSDSFAFGSLMIILEYTCPVLDVRKFLNFHMASYSILYYFVLWIKNLKDISFVLSCRAHFSFFIFM